MSRKPSSTANDNRKAHFKTQFSLNYSDEILVDLFAGGGGASTGLELGLDRPVDIAINHNPKAISMHEANHPNAQHYTTDIWAVDPVEATQGRPVGWMHASPDCTHHSQAAGGQPRKKEIRDLSWVVCRWAGRTDIRIISLENVKQILNWGPLIAKRCKETGRVIKLATELRNGKNVNAVAEPGERVPRHEQFLVPDPKRKGQTWKRFVQQLEEMGYRVEWRISEACDFGAPTSRERLFMIARKDNEPIIWPEASHARKPTHGQKRVRTAADIIDWTIPCQSIFGRKRDLAEATMKRIAKGIQRYVLDSAQPFIVPIANWSNEQLHRVDEPLRTITSQPKGGSFSLVNAAIIPLTHQGSVRTHSMDAPLPTVTTAHGGELALSSAVLVQAGHGEGKDGGTKRWGTGTKDVKTPVGTVTASGGGGHAVATAYMAQMNGGFNTSPGSDLRQPVTTITNTGSQQQLVTAHLTHFRGNCDARDVEDPLHVISASGTHHGLTTAFLSRQFGQSIGQELDAPAPTVTAGGGGKSALVELSLSPEAEAGALRVAAFLMQYYSEGGQWGGLDQPLGTVTTKDRMALVTVKISGTSYVIVDIGLRMLQPRELYRAQGFPETYIIERGSDGKPFTKSEQVHMCGNSVSPQQMAAHAAANNPWLPMQRMYA